MRSYTLPEFNLLCNRWAFPAVPFDTAPDNTDIPVQVYVNNKFSLEITPGGPSYWVPPIQLRISMADGGIMGVGDILGVDPGKSDYYRVRWVQRIHAGFVNEYMQVIVEQCDEFGATPRPS